MSTTNPQPGPPPAAAVAPPAPKPAPPPQKREVRIVSHCPLFYWWPVWMVGFGLFLYTAFTGELMLTVPSHTTINEPVKDDKGRLKYEVLVPADHKLHEDPNTKLPKQPILWMSSSKNLGVIFVVVLLFVIVVTNIPFRGLWSAIVIGMVVTLSILFAYLEWWDTIFTWLHWLDIRINAAGYLVISVVLFILWLFVMLFFDRQIYLVFTPGQLRVKLEIGGAETIIDAANMQVEKKPSDFFRHIVLGLFAGDLIVKPANSHEFHFPNVLFVASKMKEIEKMLQIKQVEAPGRTRE